MRQIDNSIRGVLFDLDNTLYNRDRAFEKWARGFVAERFASKHEDGRAEILRQIIAIDAHGYVTKHVLFTEVKARYAAITDEVEALCDRFYQDWLMHMALDAETVQLLDALDRAGIPWGIVTNGPVQQHDKILQLGLKPRTHCLFVSEEFGCNKPDPAIFRAAAARLGVPCEQILFVGDNPHADICGAHGIGMRTAWLSCGADWPEQIEGISPDFTLASLEALRPILFPDQ